MAILSLCNRKKEEIWKPKDQKSGGVKQGSSSKIQKEITLVTPESDTGLGAKQADGILESPNAHLKSTNDDVVTTHISKTDQEKENRSSSNINVDHEDVWVTPKRVGGVKKLAHKGQNKLKNTYDVLQDKRLEGLKMDDNSVGLGAFLETKLRGGKVEDMMRSYFNGWSFYKGIVNEGRILLVWKSNMLVVDIIQDSDQFIHTLIKEVRSDRKYCVTFVYGRNTIQERSQLWSDLSCLQFLAAAWLLTGDFNSVFDGDDRLGGRPMTATEMTDAQSWKALDHCYYLIKTLQEVISGFKPFRFFNMWIEHAKFKNTVIDCWNKPINAHGLDKVAKERYNQAQTQCQQAPDIAVFQTEEQTTFNMLVQQYIVYDSYLRQRSKVNWLRFGDDNTAYLHACLKQQKETNRITSFVTETGQIVENYEELALIKSFSRKDVKNAMFSIGSIKSLGPDGYGSGFFKAMWNEIGDDISDAILGFFQQGSLPKGLNNALLTLIPKVSNPTKAVEVQGCFTGRKGLRQGNPISPLLLVLIMEYFARFLIQATQNKDFKFHPRCKKLSLVSLCFADDLVLFCKGNNTSVQVIQACFKSFSAVSGLTTNLEKSRVYFGGLSKKETRDILKELQYAEGEFPLKYLGVPLRPTKWKAGDYDNIIKKIKLKLYHWSNRHLSFAGKSQLIHSVLLGIRAFWMSIFLLPKKVIVEIDHLCRKFLWGTNSRNDNRSKLHLTAWDQVCLPKQLGGVGFKEGVKWNMVLLAKYIWDVSSKQDILWVKWIDAIYLKGQSIWDYKLQSDVSWYWRKLIKLSTVINSEILIKATVRNKLNTSKLYGQLVHKDRVHYVHVVWCNLTLPKHRFILWQATLRHLLTRDNLLKCHLQLPSDLCPTCELQQECHDHLFFQCQFSQMVRHRVAEWLNCDVWPVQYQGWIEWMKGKPKGIQQKILAAGLAAAVYLIWWNRNHCLYNLCSLSVNSVISLLQKSLFARIKNLPSSKLTSKDVIFLERINLL
ncbi:uncharacterized protein LOC133814152 [Humulus lupulus]|uniref:uncharacterized protein LOC133814152 n=1 Tax=Humulus lupulus TaxID=3486 RepID=UPI002B408F09|nr:uncharacterized protein LOC133814152 [Humulus lupulus]